MIRFVDPDNTHSARIPDADGAPTFTLGFFPPREAERLGVVIAKIKKIGDVDPIADIDKAIESSGLSLDVYMTVVRYGVRGWSWPGGKSPEMGVEKIGKHEYPVLEQKSVDALYRSKLLFLVSLACLKFNTLQEEEKKS